MGGGIKAGDAVVGADPEIALIIFEDGLDGVVEEAVRCVVGGKRAGLGIELGEAEGVGDPNLVAAVLVDGIDIVVRE